MNESSDAILSLLIEIIGPIESFLGIDIEHLLTLFASARLAAASWWLDTDSKTLAISLLELSDSKEWEEFKLLLELLFATSISFKIALSSSLENVYLSSKYPVSSGDSRFGIKGGHSSNFAFAIHGWFRSSLTP